ncbi:MAG: RNA ligase (ATP) [Waterburya sp.]
MADFKVFKTQAIVFSHPNADKLELVKLGNYQCVAQKGLYRNGDTVIFAPEKSVLPENLAEPFKAYLKGKEKNRVGTVRLRGELSMGVVLPLQQVDPDDHLPLDVDISEKLGIYKYEPPIPQHLAGEVEVLKTLSSKIQHDCEQFGIYADQFVEGEPVYLFEKIHGTQGVFIHHSDGTQQVSSKGLFKRDLCLKESDTNTYWRAAKNSGIFSYLSSIFQEKEVIAFGEVIPVQGGYNYGLDSNKPEIFVFRIIVNGKEIPYEEEAARSCWFPTKSDCRLEELSTKIRWVPLLKKDMFNRDRILKVGKKLQHSVLDENQIAEGIVVSPQYPRRASDGIPLYLKIISDKYAKVEDDEAIS